MTKRLALLMGAVILLAGNASAESDHFLYAPTPAEEGASPADPAHGVLVKAIVVRKGETLKTISRRYCGRSSYFPQILLFNRIANPDLIHSGARLMVPLSREGNKSGRPAAAVETRQKKGRTTTARIVPLKPVVPAKPVAEQKMRTLFDQGKSAYRSGKYRLAIALFTEFLDTYPGSPLSSDAYLYRADSYMGLSGR